MVEFGRYALVLALGFSLYSLVAIAVGLKRKDGRYIYSGYSGVKLVFLFFSIATIALIHAFVTDNFQIEYVVSYSERTQPLFYKITGLWAGQNGSLLFWGWMLALFTAIVVWQNRNDKWHLYLPYVILILDVVLIFFLILTNFITPPFKLITQFPSDGNGLNPLLQNPGMVFHPPTLYIGYVGFSVPFAFAMAALITGEVDSWWIRKTRKWTIFSWIFLTIGIIFGGWWAYKELGWGGVWAWDPVENSSIMPWLTATAYLHSVMVQERRNMLKVWNMVLIILTFALTIFGTFLTRSGVVASVHAFGQSSVGFVFLGFVALILIFGIYLTIQRYGELKEKDNRLEALLSRESTFLYNNLILVGIAFATFWGTIFPILSEAVKGVKISVGPPFFNKVNTPLFLVLLVILSVCPLIGWRRTSWKNLVKNFSVPTISLHLSIPIFYLLGIRGLVPLLFYTLSVFILVSIIKEFTSGTKARRKMTGENTFVAFRRLVWKNRRRYGGHIIHVGIIMMVIGLVGYGFFQTKEDINIMPKQSFNIGKYKLVYNSINEYKKWNYSAVGSKISVYKGDRFIREVIPEKRFYKNQQQPTTEVAIYSTLSEDLYLILAGWDKDGKVTIRAIVNPLMQWIWIGTGVTIFGAALAMIPKKLSIFSMVQRRGIR